MIIDHIAAKPMEGALITGTGGARKIRWQSDANKNKRGGVSVIYYYHDEDMPIYLFTVYNQALAHARGEKTKAKIHKVMVPQHVNVKAIRSKLHLSRVEFANRYGFSVRTLEKWEQGVREPDGAARSKP